MSHLVNEIFRELHSQPLFRFPVVPPELQLTERKTRLGRHGGERQSSLRPYVLGNFQGGDEARADAYEIDHCLLDHNFTEAMKFVHRVADLATAADHHPRILVQMGRVTLTTTTHHEGGLTGRDIELIRSIDE